MYECLVETCVARFASDGSRHRHLVDKHAFPPSFHFNAHSHPSQKQRRKIRESGTEGGRTQQARHLSAQSRSHANSRGRSRESISGAHAPAGDTAGVEAKEKAGVDEFALSGSQDAGSANGRVDREPTVSPEAGIPRATGVTVAEPKAAMDIDSQVDQLTSALQQMPSNFTPRVVSFGRRQAKGVARVPFSMAKKSPKVDS